MKTINAFIIFAIISLLIACQSSGEKSADANCSNLQKEAFQTEIDGKKTDLFILQNGDISAAITNFGGRIVSLCAPGKNGNMADVVLGFNSIDEYLNASNTTSHGAIIGRFGNRIAKGIFQLEGQTYNLPINNDPNHLHGGPEGFQNQVWNVEGSSDTSLTLSYFSKDMEMGYPGNLNVTVKYILTNNNGLEIYYTATTDKATVINLTSHPYFNLGGEGSGTINDHHLTIYADSIVPIDSTGIPTGELIAVENTPFDFTEEKTIGKGLLQENRHEQMKIAKGFDHNYVLNKPEANKLTLGASVTDPLSGRTMEVYTTEPGIQFYSANFLDGSDSGNSGKPYLGQESFCLETQHFPDSPNQPTFPSTILKPGETFTSQTIYKFK